MFSIYSALCVGFTLAAVTTGALTATSLDRRRQDATDDAAKLWRDIKLRNGVSAPSPWHSSEASINRPGLVELHPPIHPWEAEPVPGDRLPVTSDLAINPPRQKDFSDSETPHEPSEALPELPLEPMELTAPPAAGEQARVLRLHNQGLSQNAIIKQVWAASPGGSKKYKEARRRYQQYTQLTAPNHA